MLCLAGKLAELRTDHLLVSSHRLRERARKLAAPDSVQSSLSRAPRAAAVQAVSLAGLANDAVRELVGRPAPGSDEDPSPASAGPAFG